MDDHGQVRAQRSGDPGLDRKVRPVVVPADHVRDTELEVVDHRRELVGRGAVRAQQCRSGRAQPHGAVLVALGAAGRQRPLGCLRVERTPLALPQRPLVERDLEPREVVRGSPPRRPRPSAKDPCRRSGARSHRLARRRSVGWRQRSARSRGGASRSGSGRSGLECDTRRQASIGTWPGCVGNAVEPGSDRRIRPEIEVPLVRDVRVRVQRDVGERVALADEELAGRRDAAPSRRVPRSRPSSAPARPPRIARAAPEYEIQKRATAMFGSWLYCSKNCHCSTCARS